MSERYRGTVRAPEFPAGLEWLNTERPLSLLGLRGKVVLLDFWTFCCINCQHILPQLAKLEEQFPDELVVVGVHSAKFPAEGQTFNLRAAVMRHDIRHPVVNDRDFLLWRAYAVRAWPTLVLIDPEGRVVGGHAGEFQAESFAPVIQGLVRQYEAQGKLDRTPLPAAPERWKLVETLLSFPGKLLADPEGGRLFVTDTDHHRILQFSLEGGPVRAAYGAGGPGFSDGPAGQARFRNPQGLALRGDALYVADTENHAVRKIALSSGYVTTVAGTGRQASPWPEAGPARHAALNSPWDLAVSGETLLVAMAGSHQLWRVDLHSGRLELFAGDGHEALLDGHRLAARLAQPSGLAVDGDLLWFADSETSSIRSAGLSPDGQVRTAVGQGLFEFGDVDGGRSQARLQHPLGVAAAAGLVYVADSYNHKIKVLDPARREVRTLAGSGEPGLFDGAAAEANFWEPGGITAAGEWLYVADTNNHAVRIVHRETGETVTLPLGEG